MALDGLLWGLNVLGWIERTVERHSLGSQIPSVDLLNLDLQTGCRDTGSEVGGYAGELSVFVTNACDKQFIRRKGLFGQMM